MIACAPQVIPCTPTVTKQANHARSCEKFVLTDVGGIALVTNMVVLRTVATNASTHSKIATIVVSVVQSAKMERSVLPVIALFLARMVSVFAKAYVST